MKENANRADLLPRVAAPPTSPGGPAPPPSAAAGIEATRVDQPTGRLYHERAALPEGVGARKNVAQGLREDGTDGGKGNRGVRGPMSGGRPRHGVAAPPPPLIIRVLI